MYKDFKVNIVTPAGREKVKQELAEQINLMDWECYEQERIKADIIKLLEK